MAREARMSSRTFQRRFAEATGTSPGDWLISERVDAAKQLVLENSSPMESIAAAVGFGSAHILRHHFRRKLGISPTDYRRFKLGHARSEPGEPRTLEHISSKA
jgi:AraC family transcriptional activator FtrA